MNSLLDIAGLSVHFGELRAVDQVSCSISEGSITSIIGPNGAGKTTLANVVSGLGRPTAGRITFGGKDITAWPAHRIAAAGIARTFQNIRLFRQMNVLENVLAGGQTVLCHYNLADVLLRTRRFLEQEEHLREQSVRVLERFGLRERVHDSAGSLSYGQKRLLEIARVVVRSPRLLLLDEPAAGLTPREVQELMAHLRELARSGMTIVMIEHNMNLVMSLSDRIIVLSAGRKIAEGPPEEIRNAPEVRDAYMGGGVLDA